MKIQVTYLDFITAFGFTQLNLKRWKTLNTKTQKMPPKKELRANLP